MKDLLNFTEKVIDLNRQEMMEINEKIKQEAEAYYDSSLAYHNVEHVEYVLAAAEKLMEKCRAESLAFDSEVVIYSLLFHDAGYIEDHKTKGFDSKEAYSADIAVRVLGKYGYSKKMTAAVHQAIMATHMNAHCLCNEDILVRAADLYGLADRYEVFKTNAAHLKEEFELFNKRKISWSEWKLMVVKTVELFLREELQLTSDYFDAEGESIFHKKTRANLDTLLQDNSLEP